MNWISSVIRQKGVSQKRGNNKYKARQIFRKTNISYALGVSRVSEEKKCFRKIWRALFSCYLILRFTLLPFITVSFSDRLAMHFDKKVHEKFTRGYQELVLIFSVYEREDPETNFNNTYL